MTYAQILAGGVSFQLYNKSTNAVVPTSISDGGGYIEITEDATSDHNTIYKIDQFNGAVSEITLYTEGDSAKTYALLGASQNEDVVAVRVFSASNVQLFDETTFLYLEVNGKLYIPYVDVDGNMRRVGKMGSTIEAIEDSDINGFSTLFPKTKVEIVENPQTGALDYMRLNEFKNTLADGINTLEIQYNVGGPDEAPWSFGQDGFFRTTSGSFIRINGTNHMLALNGKTVNASDFGVFCQGSENGVYNVAAPIIEGEWEEVDDLEMMKQRLEEELGLSFGNDITAVNGAIGDTWSPFEYIPS